MDLHLQQVCGVISTGFCGDLFAWAAVYVHVSEWHNPKQFQSKTHVTGKEL